MCFEVIGDLLWTPFLVDVVTDQAPLGLGEVSATPIATSAGSGIAMGNLGSVDAIVGVWISFAFAANSGAVSADGSRDLGVRVASSRKFGNGVSFLLRELSILLQSVLLFPGRSWITQVSQLFRLTTTCCTYYLNPRLLTSRST